MTTYAELVDQIRAYTETDANVLTTTIVNDFIANAENRIFREVDLDAFRSYQYAALTANNSFVSLPGTGIAEFALIRSVQIYGQSLGNSRKKLEQKDVTFMNEYWPDRTATATPIYYANWKAGNIYLAPTPDVAYNIEVALNKLPTGLSSTNTTTWVSTNAPRTLLYACLCEAFKFLKGPYDLLGQYEQGYANALQDLSIEQQGRGRRDEYMDGVLRTPLKSQQP
jgi:hypothetical protein|tara:strand:- start:527 stop:1201 length:675 start_codon:yes stop_codon:yes gene_type:complete